MSAHTPGPWFYRRGDEWSHSVVTHHGDLPDGSPNCWEVASINKRREPDHEANARLIAAAPDLLETLQEALFLIEQECADGHHTTEALRARAAITKAIGGQE